MEGKKGCWLTYECGKCLVGIFEIQSQTGAVIELANCPGCLFPTNLKRCTEMTELGHGSLSELFFYVDKILELGSTYSKGKFK